MGKRFFSIAFLCLFWLCSGLSTEAATFKDVNKNVYYYEAVEWGYQNKIISGDAKGQFNPNANVKKAEFLKMYAEFYRFNKATNTGGKWYDIYYKTLHQYELNFSYHLAEKPITRGEVAALIGFAQNSYTSTYKPMYDQQFISADRIKLANYMLNNKLSSGVITENVAADKKYGFDTSLKRAEAIQFLYNLKQKKFDTLKVSPKVNATTFSFEQLKQVTSNVGTAGNVVYHEFANDYKKYTGVFVYNGQAIAGYESAVGKTFEGIKLGVQLSDSEFKKAKQLAQNNAKYKMNVLIDEQRKNVIHAVYWQTKNSAYANVLSQMNALNAANEKWMQKAYISLLNEFRAKANKALVTQHDVLQKSAYGHSKDMAQNNYFAHKNLKGQTVKDRVLSVSNVKLTAVGENIAVGQPNIFEAHIGWMNSSGHRQNLLENYKYAGLGLYYHSSAKYKSYYTVNFASF